VGGLFTPAAVGAVFWGRWRGLGLRFSGSCWENGESVTVLLGLNAGFWDRMGSLGRLALRICYSRVFALVLDTKKILEKMFQGRRTSYYKPRPLRPLFYLLHRRAPALTRTKE